MNRLTIRTRILLGFAVVIILEMGIILYFSSILQGVHTQVSALRGMKELVEGDRDAYQSHIAIVGLLGKINGQGAEVVGKARDAVFTNLAQIASRYEEFRKAYDTSDQQLITQMSAFTTEFQALEAATAKMFDLASGSDISAALTFYQETYLPAFSTVRNAIDETTGLTDVQALQATTQISFIITNINLFVIIGLIVLAGLTVILAVIITASISRQINSAIRELTTSSTQISVASTQLSRASQEIANGAIEQASSIEETSSSIEELASMVKQNAANSAEASVLAEKTVEVSDSGYQQMEQMLASMKAINSESDRIKRIMKVIDDIAFQTNMLALNAAVEAARAGEAGMGFAVVAEEVKNLANRSAGAAQETADMIEASIARTTEGLHLAEKMTLQFRDVQANARKLALMSREVETASRQQDIGIEQVNKAIVQFDEVVQSNAGAAEETASAATELQTQVESLNELVEDLNIIVLGAGKDKISTNNAKNDVPKHKAKRTMERKEKVGKENSGEESSQEHSVSKKKSAEKLIPFEDDEDLKDL